jgi:26S proteasome regulatory subunit N3
MLDLMGDLHLVTRAVRQSDDRLMGRALRQTFSMRRKITKPVLSKLISTTLAGNATLSNKLLDALNKVESSAMDTTSDEGSTSGADVTLDEDFNKSFKAPKTVIPEVEVWLSLLTVVYLIDRKGYDQALSLSTELVNQILQYNRRTLNLLGAKAYFYYARSHELSNQPMTAIRSTLLNALRTASLRHDRSGQATLINLLLRNYLADNLVDQASKLIEKTPTIDFRSNSQLARFYYYKGRIKSIQLDYSEAYDCLMTAIRKSPTTTAKGFRLASTKLAIIVQLLMGEIPERNTFTQKDLKKPLKPYFELTKQVRAGGLNSFNDVVDRHSDQFKQDGTYTLIQRIRQNVIRTGLKKISLSYSRISFADICDKLNLDNTDDVEFIVAKAIRDGIIDATIDHEGAYVQSNDTIDIYSTNEPSEAFHKRITFCLKMHDDSVKAMRFPPNAKKQNDEELKEAEERRKSEQELVEEIVEEEEEEEF